MSNRAFHQPGQNLTEAIVGFGQYSREHGLNVGIQETLEALEASQIGLLNDQDQFRYSLKSLFCTCEDDIQHFEELFAEYWNQKKPRPHYRTSIKIEKNKIEYGHHSLVWMGRGNNNGAEAESKSMSGANEKERLRKTDFAKVAEIDSQELDQLAAKLWREMSVRLSRRQRVPVKRGRIDLRRTIRTSIGQGGDPMLLVRKGRRPRKKRLVVLLDVSGSMDKYSFYLLRFVYALQQHFEKVETFVFSTRLVRITDHLADKGLDATLKLLAEHNQHWSSGTRMGECLRTFNQKYGKRILARSPLTIVLSDGLDTGQPELLHQELQRTARYSRKLIWLNPLKGMKGYEPTAKGMNAALPVVDIFSSAHNLDSLLELENYLLDV